MYVPAAADSRLHGRSRTQPASLVLTWRVTIRTDFKMLLNGLGMQDRVQSTT